MLPVVSAALELGVVELGVVSALDELELVSGAALDEVAAELEEAAAGALDEVVVVLVEAVVVWVVVESFAGCLFAGF